MIGILALAAVILVAAILAYFAHKRSYPVDRQDLEKTIDSEVAKGVVGDKSFALVIGIIKAGRTLIRAYGTVSATNSKPPDGMTVFQIGSITKVFTASLASMLQGERFSLDDTLQKVIGSTVTLAPDAQAISLHQLATHTSGLPPLPLSMEKKMEQAAGSDDPLFNPYKALTLEDVFAYLKTAEGKKPPGKFEYSNYGMGLLGHILELLTGRSYEALLREYMFEPLAMSDTGMLLSPELQGRVAQGHSEDGKLNPPWDMPALFGAGALASTMDDMLKFAAANLKDDNEIGRALIAAHVKQLGGKTGLGWMQPSFADVLAGNTEIVWHNGRTGGYASYVSIDKRAQTALVILSAKSNDMPTVLGAMLTRHIRTQSWKEQA